MGRRRRRRISHESCSVCMRRVSFCYSIAGRRRPIQLYCTPQKRDVGCAIVSGSLPTPTSGHPHGAAPHCAARSPPRKTTPPRLLGASRRPLPGRTLPTRNPQCPLTLDRAHVTVPDERMRRRTGGRGKKRARCCGATPWRRPLCRADDAGKGIG